MKICSRGLMCQVIDEIGSIRVCGWAGWYKLGNLRDSSVKELWSNEKAKEFRRSLLDGTYDYCSEENCPWLANGTLDKHMVEIEEIPEYPTEINLAYERKCNYKCTCCCSNNTITLQSDVQKKIEKELEVALPHCVVLSGNGLGEFFASPSIMSLVSKWRPLKPEKAEFHLETNGGLFNEKNFAKISNVGNYKLYASITVMSFEEDAYQYLSGTKASVNAVIENLRFVKKLRDQGIVNYFEIATVVQERNFRTIPQFVERCLNEFGADKVRVRRFLPEKAMDENLEWFFDVRNPLHPYFHEWEKMWKHPILSDPRVFKWTGDKISKRGEIPAKAKYEAMRNLMLIEDVADKLSDKLISLGCSEIALYAIGDVCQALIKVLRSAGKIKIHHIYDRNTTLTEFCGYPIKKPLKELLGVEKLPVLVTLVARHGEMEEYLSYHGYSGMVLGLNKLLMEL